MKIRLPLNWDAMYRSVGALSCSGVMALNRSGSSDFVNKKVFKFDIHLFLPNVSPFSPLQKAGIAPVVTVSDPLVNSGVYPHVHQNSFGYYHQGGSDYEDLRTTSLRAPNPNSLSSSSIPTASLSLVLAAVPFSPLSFYSLVGLEVRTV